MPTTTPIETYQVVVECKNCGHTPKEKTPNGTVIAPLEYVIPKATDTLIFLSSKVCPNCGCKGYLRRKFS